MSPAILDTDAFSEVLAAVDRNIVANATAYEQEYGAINTSALTLFEVYKGLTYAPKPNRIGALELLRGRLVVLPIQDEEAELAGRIHGLLKRKGLPIGEIDPLIAATALTNQLVLVTGNADHYQRIIDLGFPLKLVDWRHS